MTAAEKIKGEVTMGLKLVAYKSVKLEVAPMSVVEEAMKENDWHPLSAISGNGIEAPYRRYYYNTATKTYALLQCSGYTGECSIEAADERDVLEALTFAEMKVLAGLIDKKSVAFITTFSQKQLAAAESEEELNALNARNKRMIDEAEVALRKR
ncbi:MAG: hypothetical protein IJ617_06630 [Oscillospiraceae bacterium]|nr:hypothetical protein [Oscillospiraceae bacterium]